jgi:hypothetical protein
MSTMQYVESRSWRFAQSAGDQMPHAALFVRDALGLSLPTDAAVPPRLSGMVPDHRARLSVADRVKAEEQWVSWCKALLGIELRRQEEPPHGDHRARSAALRAERGQAGAPPDFAALADRPALRRAVVATFDEALRWINELHHGQEYRPEERGFPYHLVRRVAEEVAFDRSVPAERVRGTALVLAVEGEWWHLSAPGVVVCSVAAAEDPRTGHLVLRRAFESALQG